MMREPPPVSSQTLNFWRLARDNLDQPSNPEVEFSTGGRRWRLEAHPFLRLTAG
jgi:hypothetical protein